MFGVWGKPDGPAAVSNTSHSPLLLTPIAGSKSPALTGSNGRVDGSRNAGKTAGSPIC
jgi:hypothetical protein